MPSRLVIGLDFGTTYSGVAYADDVQPDKIRLITCWPGKQNSNSDKVPSRISYAPATGNITWGNKARVAPGQKVHAGFKLKLDLSPASARIRDLLLMIAGIDLNSDMPDDTSEFDGRSVLDVVSDYLTKVREIAVAEIKTQIGESTWDSMRRELVITVPAVWSERARDLTRRAADNADFQVHSRTMIAEPEAAALYTLKDMMRGVSNSEVQYGDAFVLTDCGGGTVDLISYKITGTLPYTMVEAAVGNGDKCGALFVQKNFLEWFEKWIGEEEFKRIPDIAKSYGSVLLKSFEECVYSFEGGDDEFLEVSLPNECEIIDDESLNISRGILLLTKEQMCGFFEKSVNRTLELIDDQIKQIHKTELKKPKMVFVVGGFGRNEYLYNRIRKHCSSLGIETRRPAEAWPAIVKGAVCRGLEDPKGALVSKRLARKHYGSPCSETFEEGRHDEDDAFISEYTGVKMAGNQIDWMVARGCELPVLEPKTFSITLGAHFDEDEERSVNATLVGSYEDEPPKKFMSKGTYVICRVEADISDIPLHAFLKRKNTKGKDYYSTLLVLKATFDGMDIVWTVMCNGKEYGSAKVSFDA